METAAAEGIIDYEQTVQYPLDMAWAIPPLNKKMGSFKEKKWTN